MFVRTTLFQILCAIFLNSSVIIKSIIDPDDNLTLPTLRLLSSKAQGPNFFYKTIQTLSCWYLLETSH